MCTNVIALHIFIDFSHDDPAQILRATTIPDFWARLVIGLRTVWVAGCSMARKRSARWTLCPCTRTMVSSGFTRSTCLLNCLMPELTKVQKFLKFQLYLIKSYFQFGILIHVPTYLPTSQHHALSVQAAWLVRILQAVRSWAATSTSSIDHPNHLMILVYWSFRSKTIGLNCAWGMRQFKACFWWYFISHQMSFTVKLSLFNLILIHSETRKSHKNTASKYLSCPCNVHRLA